MLYNHKPRDIGITDVYGVNKYVNINLSDTMSDTKYLIQRKGLWLFNWRVPKDCIDLFDGKKTITKSLGTHKLPEARLRRNQMLAEVQQQANDYRSGHKATVDTEAYIYRENVKLLLEHDHDALDGAYEALTWKLERLEAEHGDLAPDLSEVQNQLLHMNKEDRAKAIKEAYLKTLVSLIPDPIERAQAKALQNVHIGIQHDLTHVTLLEALKLHHDDNEGQLKVNTLGQIKTAVERFLTTTGKDDLTLKSIGRMMVKDFIKEQQKGLSGATVNNYVTFLSGIWNHAHDLELVEGANPFAKHKIDSTPTESYQLFEDRELEFFFKNTQRFKNHPEYHYRYLIPRLGYVTGCRIEELCSLTCEQIVTDHETGITYFEVLEGKTTNAKRKIPLHDWVVDDVVKLRDSLQSGLLFPSLTTQRRDGKRSDKVSKWFGRLKREQGITKRSKAFHSFRVHVATYLERGDIPESTAVWILGHTRTASLSYGLYSKGMDLETLKKAVNVIPVTDEWR
jgi:integrase